MSREDNLYRRAELSGVRLSIYHEDSPESPRKWDNAFTMVCFHRKYDLGDEGHGYDKNDFNSWEELAEQIKKDHEPVLIQPLYLYDHSGITISTGQFACKWDSGQVGFIFISAEKFKEEWGEKTKETLEIAQRNLDDEVKTYDQYLTGDVYGFVMEEVKECGECGDKHYTERDSCWGFYGDDFRTNGMIYHIEADDETKNELIENLK